MSTICFDIKRVDDDYVCIQHCELNKFDYECHLGFSFFPRKEKSWLEDKYYKYVWVVIEKADSGIEEIVWACNDKRWLNRTIKLFFKNKDIRIIKLPFHHVKERVTLQEDTTIPIYETTNLKDKFKLYCPVELNEKHHVYTDCFQEIEPTERRLGDFVYKERQFKWMPPKYLEM